MNWFKKNEWRKKILFISSPITAKLEETETLDYFAYIVSILSQKIENVFPNYDLVVKVPEDGGNTTDKQIKIINDAINIINKNKNEYVAVILSPYDKTKERDYVINLCNISKTLLIDQGYYTDEEIKYFKQKKVDRPPFVQSDWEQGGKIAGQLLISYLQKKAIKSPNILIVKGNIGSEERIKGFKEPLNNSSLNPSYWEPINGQYSMQITSKVFSDFYEELKSTNNKIDAIFCTNDAMALGVKEVLANDQNLSTNVNNPVIIGYDGIRDFTLSMKFGDPFLFGTVDVQLLNQIHYFLNVLKNYIDGKELTDDIKYKHYPNISYKYKV